ITKWIEAVLCESESGATTLSTLVREIGLFSSFRFSVTANAAAVQPRRASTTTVGRLRPKRVTSLVGASSRFGPRPPPKTRAEAQAREGRPREDRPRRDHVVRTGEVDQLDAAQHQHGGEPESQRPVGNLQRELARNKHPQNGRRAG